MKSIEQIVKEMNKIWWEETGIVITKMIRKLKEFEKEVREDQDRITRQLIKEDK